MESVDKLRELPVFGAVSVDGDLNATNQRMVCATKEEVLEIADAIEAEIAERYMALPVDADGVPIRVNDRLIAYNERVDVEGVGDGIVIYRTENDELCLMFNPAAAIHVKPRTLEDVLADFAADVENDRNTIETARKYADEIRELLLGGDA